MARPVTLFTGQWADLGIEQMARMTKDFGYDGIELACWGDHFEVQRALKEPDYCAAKRDLLARHGLQCHAISAHLVGQVNGFTGSSIWHLNYSFPPVPQSMIDDGYRLFAERFNPILDVFGECGVRFALEVHPTEIAFDLYSAQAALDAIGHREEFGFNFDPSHLIWQGVDPVEFLRAFPDRIYHVHVKDATTRLNGKSGILSSHLNFGDPRRGWDFRSPGRGSVNFEEIIRTLNDIGYRGPLSVEWEDSGMDREFGAREAAGFVRRIDFSPSNRAFDSAFEKS